MTIKLNDPVVCMGWLSKDSYCGNNVSYCVVFPEAGRRPTSSPPPFQELTLPPMKQQRLDFPCGEKRVPSWETTLTSTVRHRQIPRIDVFV
jgi:hypothetical protein